MNSPTNNISVTDIDKAIQALSEHTDALSIEPLIAILEQLKEDPYNESLLAQLADTWRNLGVFQGTVLTYVPLFYTWIPDDIFGDKK